MSLRDKDPTARSRCQILVALGVSPAPGVGEVFSLLLHANKQDEGIHYTLSGGDLSTMARHASFLHRIGMNVGFNDVYPGFKTREEKKQALQLLYDSRISGWQCHKNDLLEYGICTEKEYKERTGRA